MQQATEKNPKSDMQARHCRGYLYLPASALIYYPLTFALADTVVSYSLAKHGRGKTFFPPVLSGWKEVTAENFMSSELAAAAPEQ